MRGFNAEENPYWDKYRIWDDWIYRHAVADEFDPNLAASLWVDSQSPFFETMIGNVDANGFLIPLVQVEEERQRALRDPTQPASPNHKAFIAQGILPPQVAAAMDKALLEVQARYAPAVPAWLANEPPLWAMLWDDGRVITHGIRDSGGKGMLGAGSYCIYSADGILLERITADRWLSLFWPGWEEFYRECGANDISERDGWVYFLERIEGEGTSLLEVRNYDGNRQADVDDGHTRSKLQFSKLAPPELMQLRDMQVHQKGKTT